jgi:PAS domain S-box-containing protein
MKANTAIALVLGGFALRCAARGTPRALRRLVLPLAAIVATVGALSLAENAFGVDLGLDQLVFVEAAGDAAQGSAGRMAPATALSFVLVAPALAAIEAEDFGNVVGMALATACLAIAWLRIVLYVFGGKALIGGPLWTSMAISTAVGLLLLAAGVIAARPDAGGMRLFSARGAGGASARRLVPAAVLLPLLVGSVAHLGLAAGYYDPPYRLSLTVVVMTVVLVAVLLVGSGAQEAADVARRRAEERLARSEARWRTIADYATDIIARNRPDGTLVYVSQAFRTATGFAPEEAIGRLSYEFALPEDIALMRAGNATALESDEVHTARFRLRRKDGGVVWLDCRFQALPSLSSPDEREIASVSRDVTAQVAIERMRSDFVAMLSHDLKNPLGILSAYIDMIDDAADEGARREVTGRMRPVLESAARLARNMVDAIRIESGALPLARHELSLDALVADVAREHEGAARLKEVSIDVSLGDVPHGRLDEGLVRRALDNLLSNAIEFAPPGSRIEVATSAESGRARLEVRDRGPGVASDARATLFERFKPGASSRRESTGLGLFIVRCVAEAHGGSVRYEPLPGGGSCFRVELPLEG